MWCDLPATTHLDSNPHAPNSAYPPRTFRVATVSIWSDLAPRAHSRFQRRCGQAQKIKLKLSVCAGDRMPEPAVIDKSHTADPRILSAKLSNCSVCIIIFRASLGEALQAYPCVQRSARLIGHKVGKLTFYCHSHANVNDFSISKFQPYVRHRVRKVDFLCPFARKYRFCNSSLGIGMWTLYGYLRAKITKYMIFQFLAWDRNVDFL